MFHALVFLPVCLSLLGSVLRPTSDQSPKGVIQISNIDKLQGISNETFQSEEDTNAKRITLTKFQISLPD